VSGDVRREFVRENARERSNAQRGARAPQQNADKCLPAPWMNRGEEFD